MAENEATREQATGGAGATVAEELKKAIREAMLEVVGPAAREATSSAAKFAVSKGPELVTKAVGNAGGPGGLAQQVGAKGAGGIGGLAGRLMSKLRGRGSGGDASGWGRKRRMPVQQHIYVSVPVKDAYNGWTEYKQWPRYMHRANQVDAEITEKEARVKVTEKLWGFKRPFTASVVTQRPNEHIKWNSTEGTKHTGVINFHELGPRLTLIELNLDHSPSGPLEKIARGARFTKRAVRADFHRFQGWIEMKSEEELADLEGWRGTIEGGEIVTSHEDAMGAEQDGHHSGDGHRPDAAHEQSQEQREPAAGDEAHEAQEQREPAADEAREAQEQEAAKQPAPGA